jgi:hypothetical protein
MVCTDSCCHYFFECLAHTPPSGMLLNWNELVKHSVVLVVPWILFLFLPSVFAGLVTYYSLAKRYRFILTDDALQVSRINSKKEEVDLAKQFSWAEVTGFHFSDFEDNQYFKLEFSDKKNNLVLHRNSGDFESFFEELKKYVK